jgi:nucleolar pre-ribosomal-associated protein 1
MSSILRSPVFLTTIQNENDAKCNLETTELYIKQLVVIKLLRTLLTFKIHQDGFDFGKDLGIDLREVHLLLLSSYGATLTEIDVEIYNLMRTIECIDGLEHIRFAGIDYLWGSASLKIEKERNLEQSLSYDIMNDAEAVKEHCRNQLRENLAIDPKICASTVLYFPYHIVASDELLSLNKFQTDLVEDKDAVCILLVQW